MAATLDDLTYIAAALRVDVRAGLDEVVKAMQGGGTGAPRPSGGQSQTGTFDNLTGRLERFAVSAGKASIALTTFTLLFDRMINGLGQSLSRFVATANPAAVLRFNIAVENAQSALGRVFVPVLERFTAIIQSLGNAIESLSPQAKSLVASLATGAGLTGVFGGLAAAVAVVVKLVGGWATVIVALVGAFAGVLTTTASGAELMRSFQGVLKAVGTVFEKIAQVLIPIAASVAGPVLATLSKVVGLLGETVIRVLAALGPGIKAALGVFTALVVVVGELVSAALPLIQAVLVPLGGLISVVAKLIAATLIPALEMLAHVVRKVADFISDAVGALLNMLGMNAPEMPRYNPNERTAVSVRQSQITDLRGALNRAYTTAFGGASTDYSKSLLEEAKTHTGKLDQIIGRIDEYGRAATNRPGKGERDLAQRGYSIGGETGRSIGKTLGAGYDLARKYVKQTMDPLDIMGRMERLFS